MLIDSRQVPAWNTPISSKWKSWEVHHTVKCNYTTQSDAPVKPDTHPKGGPVSLGRNSTTSFLTTTTLIYTIEAGITAAAGTRLALQWVLMKRVWVSFIPIARHWCLVLWFLVTTSLFQDWVICVPAAFLRCGCRFSGSLSGVKPWFSVTRHCRGKPIPDRRKLIGQILEWGITSWHHTIHSVTTNQKKAKDNLGWFDS